MRIPRQRTRVALLAAVAALAALVGLASWGAGALDRLERVTLDARYQVRGDRAPSGEVIVVGVDQKTLTDRRLREQRWPFSRATQARVIERLTAAKAKVIAYDILLAGNTDPDADQRIYEAIAGSRRVVLAATEYSPEQGPNVMFLDEDLAAAGASVGHVGFPETPDNTFRRAPLGVDGLASFGAVAAGRYLGGSIAGSGSDRSVLIDYAGGPGTIPLISYSDVLMGTFDARAVRGRVAVVGTTSPELGDTHPTPFGGTPMSGPEINANVIATFLASAPLGDAPGWLDVLVILALAALGAAAALRRVAWFTVFAALAVAGAFLVVAQLAFSGGTVLDVTDPLLALVLASVGGVVVNFATVDRQRARLRTEFARFVPAAVVDQVMEQVGDDQRLGGRRIYCTVMFADLRGFTAAAERLPPETVIEMLNRYLGEMSDAILDCGGTVVSFMGDGIMALFGAPIELPDHADRAVAAARQMRDVRLPAFNAWCAGRVPGEGFRMGVGIASGPVMSGNVGSQRRMEYAAVGDTTNVASRLQSLTKETPAMVLIADSTRAALTAPVADLEAVGALDVRGREVPAAVWTLAEPAGGVVSPP